MSFLGDIFDTVKEFTGIGDSALGGLLGGGLSFLGQLSANSANQANAQAQMAFQERMSGTSYQRAVEDMQKAGLSPMLAYSQGGASTPGGAMSVAQNALGAGVHSATQAAPLVAQIANTRADTENKIQNNQLIDSQVLKTDAEAANAIAENPNIRAKYKNIVADTAVKNTIARMNSALASQTEYMMPKAVAEGKYYDTFGYGPFALRDATTGINSAANVVRALNPFTKTVNVYPKN